MKQVLKNKQYYDECYSSMTAFYKVKFHHICSSPNKKLT